ncbi:MAG: hypothetical protein WKF47_04540 [Geodermatophilaceae bacterium]
MLHRCTEWRSPNGRSVRVRSQRLVSLVRRSDCRDLLRGRADRCRW